MVCCMKRWEIKPCKLVDSMYLDILKRAKFWVVRGKYVVDEFAPS